MEAEIPNEAVTETEWYAKVEELMSITITVIWVHYSSEHSVFEERGDG